MDFILVSENGIVLGSGVSRNMFEPGMDRGVDVTNYRCIVELLGRSCDDSQAT